MGCYDYTCAVSALPISAGTPVVALLIQESRWSERSPWVVRSLPVYAKYNDYGGIEEYPHDIRMRAWTESLKHDAIEKGVGDNEFHNRGYRPHTATFDELLTSLHSDDAVTVDIKTKLRSGWESSRTPPPEPKEIPTIGSIEEALGDLKSCVLVDSTNTHEFRVRASNYSEGAKPREEHHALMEECLVRLAPLYAVMHTCGSGNYAHGDSELVVRPKPGAKQADGHYANVYREDKQGKDIAQVKFVLIRRDVWDFLLHEKTYEKVSKWDMDQQTEDRAKILQFMFPERVAEKTDSATTELSERIAEMRRRVDEIRMDISHYSREYPFIEAMARRSRTHETSPDEIDILKKDTLDLLTVLQRVIVYCRVALAPRNLVGEQHGNLAIAAKYHAALAKMVRAQKKERGW